MRAFKDTIILYRHYSLWEFTTGRIVLQVKDRARCIHRQLHLSAGIPVTFFRHSSIPPVPAIMTMSYDQVGICHGSALTSFEAIGRTVIATPGTERSHPGISAL